MQYKSIVFDAYGTLFDITAAARKSALVSSNSLLKSSWEDLAEIWRKKQIEYTWLQNILNSQTDFRDIKSKALDFALEEMTLEQDPKLRETLLDLYWTSEVYPEVGQILKELNLLNINLAILSNGTLEMLLSACSSTEINKYFDFIVLLKNSFVTYSVSMLVKSPVNPTILSGAVSLIFLIIILLASFQEIFSNLFLIFLYGLYSL